MADQDANTGGIGTGDLAGASNTPSPQPTQDPSAVSAKGLSVPAMKLPPNIAEEVGLPKRDIETLPPQAPLSNDIAHILKEVKLPERKEVHTSADTVPLEKTPEPSTETPQPPEPTPKPRDVLSTVHTLKDDFQTAVQDQKLTLVQAAALEQDKRAHQAAYAPDPHRAAQTRKTIRLLAVIASFVALGVVASGATYLIIQNRQGIPPVAFLVDGLLFSEQTIPLPLQNQSASDIKYQLGQARAASGLTLGAIARIAPIFEELTATQEPIAREATTQEFFTALEARLPEELLRALGPVFFFGFHAVDENAPLLIIPVTSYERAFAGMLAWEKNMNTDLSPIFTGVSVLKQENGQLVERTFTDTVMRNYDVRVLKDDSGVVQLFYSFPTRDVLIIAESQYSFAEILARLRAERRL